MQRVTSPKWPEAGGLLPAACAECLLILSEGPALGCHFAVSTGLCSTGSNCEKTASVAT